MTTEFEILPTIRDEAPIDDLVLDFYQTDGGRADAGFTGKRVGDCVTRAIAICLDKPYGDVRKDLMQIQREWIKKSRSLAAKETKRTSGGSVRNGVFREVYTPYLEDHGYKRKGLQTIGSSFRAKPVKSDVPSGRVILKMRRHLAACIDWVLHDKYDSRYKHVWKDNVRTSTKTLATVYSIWTKE